MAISKEKKQQLLKEYEAALKASNNTVVIQQSGVEVNDITAIRKELHAT
jgi:ribosomal protein L10